MDKNYLSYEQFGAVGDGQHDDIEAIIACHEEANRTGRAVKTKDGATYYIGGRDISAIINTDVNFGTSKFIIDDRNVERRTSYVFIVKSENEFFDLDTKSLTNIKSGQKTLDLPYEDELFVKIFDDNKKIFIRKGLNMNDGTSTTDCFILRKDGSVYPSIDWDYPEVTRAKARPTNDEPITIKGGVFVTIANEGESYYNYHHRGFDIRRSHVTITNFEHYVENEGEHGAPYHGFIRTDDAYDVTISNAIITPRFIYKTESKIPGKSVDMGSYDLSFYASIDVRCIGVKQSIDICDSRYWGIYTSNFCKNLYLEDCVFSRFDAHQGVTNATIRNCTLGYQSIQLIGHGEFLVENTKIKTNRPCFIYLRCDYGSIWHGNITIRNCEFENTSNFINVIGQNNTGDHDYGYVCYMPENITIDGFKLLNGKNADDSCTKFALLSNCDGAKEGLPYRYRTTKKLTLSNISAESGKNYVVTYAPENYDDLSIITK